MNGDPINSCGDLSIYKNRRCAELGYPAWTFGVSTQYFKTATEAAKALLKEQDRICQFIAKECERARLYDAGKLDDDDLDDDD